MGFVIFPTNDDLYWRTSRNLSTADKDFRIHEGRILKGTLKWKEGTSKGTMRGREESIRLTGEYTLRWKDYSDLKRKNGRFRYLLVKVKHGNII